MGTLTTRLKVLHIHTRAVIGGSGANTLFTMDGLDKNRFEPILACGPQGGALLDEAGKMNLRTEVIPHLANQINFFKDILAFFELKRLIKRERFDIVHTHNSKAGILGRLAARCCRVPIIIHTVHSCVFLYSNLSAFQRKLFYCVEKFAAPFADKYIAISRPLQDEFIKAHIAPAEKFVTIYSGIDLAQFKKGLDVSAKKRDFGIAQDEFVVGTVTRLAPGKGVEVFLRAAARAIADVPNVRFLIVGEGPLKDRLIQLAQELNISQKCIFTGLRQDVERITTIFDVSVLASFYEGMGRVVLESQAEGKPVVASKVGGIPDIVNDGQTGILVSPGDDKAFAAAIIKLLKDATLRGQMARAAAEWVGYRFSREKMVADIVELYEQLIRKKLKI
ncbi:MAG: glycosyltransferase family 4 protein [Candidatus Omnitrophica bacterium]|nr:glycosyltransferase family 4 protein [Candidatus Omnitrophota bacterium]